MMYSSAFSTNPGLAPLSGIENAVAFHSYGDMPPWGKGPDPSEIQ
jgi:hypothetical protein